jgi:hypothetical protein
MAFRAGIPLSVVAGAAAEAGPEDVSPGLSLTPVLLADGLQAEIIKTTEITAVSIDVIALCFIWDPPFEDDGK